MTGRFAGAGDAVRPAVLMLGTFGLRPKGTMSARAVPIAQALVERGWTVQVVLAPWDAPDDAGQTVMVGDVPVVNVGLAGGSAAIVGRMVRVARQFERRCAARGPVVAHCFKPKGYAGLAVTALRLGGWRCAVDLDDWEGRGGWNDSAGYSLPQRLLFEWQWRTLPRQATGVTAASRTLEAFAWAQGAQPRRVQYLPNGVSPRLHAAWRDEHLTPTQARQQAGLPEAPTVVLYTRFDVVSPERVIGLLARLRQRHASARLLVVGEGPPASEARLRRAARTHDLVDAISTVGRTAFEHLPGVLRCAEVGIYPIADTLINRSKAPVKLLELLALGIPTVAERIGETAAYLDDGTAGLLTATGDDEALVAAMAHLLDSPSQRLVLGAAARDWLWRTYTWDQLVHRVEPVYRQMVDGSASGTQVERNLR